VAAAYNGQIMRRLFDYPFRIFFLSTAIWAVVAILLWVGLVTGQLALAPTLPFMDWHRHELLFGFVTPAIAGFLLTAVCVWTSTERLHGPSLCSLWLVWLAARVLNLWDAGLPLPVMQAVNLAFLPLVALDAGRRIVRARQGRHAIILVVLALLWLAQAAFLLHNAMTATGVGLLAVSFLMLVIGGRITPAFSANWLRLQGGEPDKVRLVPQLEIALVIAGASLVLALLLAPPAVAAVLAALLAALVTVRIVLWRGWLVRAEPLLWILHLSLLWLPVGLVLLAGQLLAGWPPAAWQHAIGSGAIGGLVLGVMARVALGHTGRPLRLPPGMTFAFILVHLAAAVRVATALALLPWQPGILLAGIAWTAAWLIFLWRYTAILASPRVDGKPG